MRKNFLYSIVIILYFVVYINGGILVKDGEDRNYINDKIYQSIVGDPCVMLADGDSLMGCTSKYKGSNGILYPLNTTDSIQTYLNLKSLFGSKSFIPVIDSSLLSEETLKSIDSFDLTIGIVITSGYAPINGFSPASTFPNQKYGLHNDSTHIWNKQGNSLNLYQFKKPIFNVDPTNSTNLMNYASENLKSNSWPKWSAELDSFMYTSKNSASCMNRLLCDPIGGLNVWGTFEKDISNSKKKSVLSIVSFDSTSLFHTKSVGAESDISGLVALLGAIDAISSSKLATSTLDKQLAFAFFNAESYGYTGSKKFVADLKKCSSSGNCNAQQLPGLNWNDIDSIVEMRQVGYEGGFWIHQESTTDNSNIISAFQSSSNQTGVNVSVMASSALGIPPSSTMSFLKSNPSIPAIVLTDHQGEYRNKFYQSIFDNYESINVQAICQASTLFANTIYKLASGNLAQNNNITANCSLIQQITYCLTKQINCEYLAQYLPGVESIDPQPTNYPGIIRYFNPYVSSPQSKFIHDFVAQKTYSLPTTCTQSTACPRNSNCISGQCVSYNSTFYHLAYSPALEITNDGWKIVDQNEPLFTESVWSYTGMKIYLKENPSVDIFMLCLGTAHMGFWIVLVFFGSRYLSKKWDL